MNCIKSKDIYSLTPSLIRTRYATHLEDCVKCRQRIDAYEQVRRLVILAAGSPEKSPNASACIDPLILLD